MTTSSNAVQGSNSAAYTFCHVFFSQFHVFGMQLHFHQANLLLPFLPLALVAADHDADDQEEEEKHSHHTHYHPSYDGDDVQSRVQPRDVGESSNIKWTQILPNKHL